MPLDINMFRESQGGRPDLIRESQRRRFASVAMVDDIIAKDEKWRNLTGDIDNMRKRRNKIQKEEVAAKMKAKQNADAELALIKTIDQEIVEAEQAQKEVKTDIDKLVNKIGNIVEDGVPTSKDEDADNLVVRKWGNPRDPAGLLNHHDLLWRIGGYEPERGSNVAGHKGYFLRDAGVLLNQAFINYGIAFLRKRNYSVVQPPFMMKKEVMAGVAQLEEFDEALYKVTGDGDDNEKYLIATSEQPLCGFHMDEWMDEKALPIRYGGISTCFRKEAGSAGRDVWGIFRVHQFEKVEQFVIVEGDLNKSMAMQEEMILAAEEFYQSLGFPYHVINIVSGALNNAAIKKYDLECWFPGYNSYRELVSCSNCTDYQSRSMGIRCGAKKLGATEKKYVHMLNATLCATGRAICCLLETYQDVDGVHIPEVLVPFMGGITFLPFIRASRMSVDKPIGTSASTSATAATDAKVEKAEKVATPAPAKVVASATSTAPPVATTTSTPTITAPAVEPTAVVSAAAATVTEEVLSPEVKIVVDGIAAKGDAIRVLKAAKGSKEDIGVLVDQLLKLKNEYKALTGKDYVAPGTATQAPAASVPKVEKLAKEPKEKTEKKEKVVYTGEKGGDQKKVKTTPAPTAVVSPATTSSASIASTTTIKDTSKPAVTTIVVSVPTVAMLVSNDGKSVNLSQLDSRLKIYGYVTGFSPSKEDLRIYNLIQKDAAALPPNVSRWYRQIASYSVTEQTLWK